MAAGFVGSTKNFPFSFDVDVEEEEPGRSTPHLSKRIDARRAILNADSFDTGDLAVIGALQAP
ncbi:hypothetical protein RR46_13337 [Papilio xuthus]|uniref:Uncharacterized protein n=1 Tax=Papilio xuthus TaxID=66420 RepID=A0A194PFH0_PAPXU|nr:hypothetical protein RR46_13337 [Papilio xuthus]